MQTSNTNPTILVQTRNQVESLKEGNDALDCFGKMQRVTSIFGRGHDTQGKAYVCYYTEHGAGGTISHRMKEGARADGAAYPDAYLG